MKLSDILPDEIVKKNTEYDQKVQRETEKAIKEAHQYYEKLKNETKKENKISQKKTKYNEPISYNGNASRPTYGGTKKNAPYKQGVLNGSGPVTINGIGIPMSNGRIS